MAEVFRREAREPFPLLLRGYKVDWSDPDVLVLNRADGSFVAAFSSRGVSTEGLQGAVEVDLNSSEASEGVPRKIPPLIGGSRRPQNFPRSESPEASPGAAWVGEASRRARPPSGTPYWLVARGGSRDTEILTIGGSSGELSTLPIFGFKEGAMEFVRWCTKGSGWQARLTGIGELLSLLCGSCADVECVALDPSPEIVAERALALVSLSRQSFVDSILGRGRPWFEDLYRKEGGAHR